MSITSIVFLLLFPVGCFLTLTRSPVYGVITCVSLYFVNPPGSWWYGQVPDIRYTFIANLVLAISFLRRMGEYKSSRYVLVPHCRLLVVLLLVVLVSIIWAVDPISSNKFVLQWIKIGIFGFIAFKVVKNSKELDWVLTAYCIGCFYTGFHAWQFGRQFGNRLEVIRLADGSDGNGVAVAILLSVPLLVFYLFWGKRIWVRICTLVALAFVINALVLINSRGAFLGLVCAMGMFAMRVVLEKKDLKLAMKVATAGFLCLGGMLYLADDAFWERMASLKDPNIIQSNVWDEPVTDIRTEYWWKSFDMLADYPLGAGPLGYEALSPEYLPAEWLTKGKRAVHSTWFEVLTSFGYHGLLLYIGYLLCGFHELRKVRYALRVNGDDFRLNQSFALEASLVAFIVPGTFLSAFFAEFGYWPMLFIAMFFNVYWLQQQPSGMGRVEPISIE